MMKEVGAKHLLFLWSVDCEAVLASSNELLVCGERTAKQLWLWFKHRCVVCGKGGTI